MRKVKLGIVGAGQMTEGHLTSLSIIPDVEVVALADPYKKNLENKGKMVERLGLSKKPPLLFAKFQNLLRVGEIEGVVVSTPNYTHKDITVQSLESGKHVLCEKPMATSVEDAVEMIKASERSGKGLQVGLEYRHAPLYKKMKHLISKGEIGKPWLLWCKEFRGPFLKKAEDWIVQKDKSGGSLVEKDCHHFDLFTWYTDSKPLRVSGFGGNEVIYKERDVLDHAWVIVEYENGARACLGLCFFSPYGNDILEFGIIGDKGKMESYQSSMEITIWKKTRPQGKIISIPIPSKVRRSSHNGAIYYEWKHFIRVIRGEEKPYPDGNIGLWSIAVPLAAEKAVVEKRVVEIKEVM